MKLSDEHILELAHRKASTYAHRSAPAEHAYGFVKRTMLDFARALLAATPAAVEGAAPALTLPRGYIVICKDLLADTIACNTDASRVEAMHIINTAHKTSDDSVFQAVLEDELSAAPAAALPPTVDAPVDSLQDRYDFVLAACRDAQDMASRYGWALHDIAQGADPVARARAALLGTDGVSAPAVDAPSGETEAQREEVCAAWSALPDDLRKDAQLTRLYRALGGPRMDNPSDALRTHLNTALGAEGDTK